MRGLYRLNGMARLAQISSGMEILAERGILHHWRCAGTWKVEFDDEFYFEDAYPVKFH